MATLAAAHILEGVAANALNPLPMTSPAPAQTGIKPEDLNGILDKFAQTILAVLATKPYTAPRAPALLGQASDAVTTGACFGCGELGHTVKGGNCPHLEEAIKAGLCHQNIEGKIVLSTGAFCPRNIPGAMLVDCIEEWHRRNPNQIVKGQLSSNANTSQMMYDCIEVTKSLETSTLGMM